MTTPEPEAVIDRIQRRALVQPDAAALSDLDEILTYRALIDRVARRAAHLGDLRASPPVVVRCGWDVGTTVNVLAVLWAGGAVVPVSAEDPAERVGEVAARTGAGRVLDTTDPLGDADPSAPLQRAGDDPRVVFFTSGSSGRPKAVVRSSAAVDRHISIELGNDDVLAARRTALFMPLHFAGGFTAWLGGLAAGRFTALIDARRTVRDQLDAALTDLSIERLHLVPSLMGTLASTARQGAYPTVGEIWVGGEMLDVADVNMVRERLPHVRTLTSYYAASELTAVLAIHTIDLAAPCTLERIPIGRPRNPSGVRIAPVDGVVSAGTGQLGELVVRGEVAQGYLDDAALTEQRFGTDDDGVRLWRSRDLVLLDDDGVLWHRGRLDDMVKVNGRLVEPSETEHALRRLDGVRDAVVTVRNRPSGGVQLVAHVVVRDGVDASQIRSSARRSLPGHLLPGVLMRHESLPLTERGKVDRAALREVTPVPWRSTVHRADHDDRVSVVCADAAMALDLDEVLPDDNLWDLGLDSLAALELITSISEAIGVELDPSSVAGMSTCREISAYAASAAGTRGSHVVPINDVGSQLPVFAVTGAGGTALAFRFLASELGPRQPLIAYEQFGLHQSGRRDRTIAAAAGRNLDDLLRRQPAGPYVLVGHSWGGLVAHEMAARLIARGHEVRLVILDTLREVVHQPVLQGAPPAISSRQDVWPVWAGKWAIWRAHRLSRMLRRRFRDVRPPIGSAARYGSFQRTAVRSMRRHRVALLEVSGAVIYPAGSPASSQWSDHPNLVPVEVGGDHLEMMRYPYVAQVAEVIRAQRSGMVN